MVSNNIAMYIYMYYYVLVPSEICDSVKYLASFSVPDFSVPGAWSEERLAEYVPTITYEAESPDEAALVEVHVYIYG